MLPNLNWLEWQNLARQLHQECAGLFVERVLIPHRSRFPDRYLKNEWALQLGSRGSSKTLVLSARARAPYCTLLSTPLQNTPHATQSAFGLNLAQSIRGLKIGSISTLPQERILVIHFEVQDGPLALVLVMIPAAPEALLVRPHTAASAWPVIVRSRINLGNTLDAQNFTIPTGSNAPIDPPLRDEHKTLSSYTGRVESYLNEEAFLLRKATAQKILKDLLKQAKLRVTQATTAKREAESDQDWNRLGTLLKATLHDPAPLLREGKLAFRVVHDYETEQEVKIPADPRLEASAQVEKYFQLAKRRARRIQEATERAQNFSETVARIESDLVIPLADLDWTALERLERAAGITPPDGTRVPLAASKEKKRARSWLGRTFFSKDGSPLWIGRNKDENLELTFKHAKGNDIWLHVRGKPGAHGVVPLSPGKSASLETLIDAAMLVIYYSNGENWGKTEVDYTFKKYVKRIKDSTEASYTHNKTLLITPDPARLEKLLKI